MVGDQESLAHGRLAPHQTDCRIRVLRVRSFSDPRAIDGCFQRVGLGPECRQLGVGLVRGLRRRFVFQRSFELSIGRVPIVLGLTDGQRRDVEHRRLDGVRPAELGDGLEPGIQRFERGHDGRRLEVDLGGLSVQHRRSRLLLRLCPARNAVDLQVPLGKDLRGEWLLRWPIL